MDSSQKQIIIKKGLILIPAYNEAESIDSVVASIPRTIEGIPFDILIIDDGSTDGTADFSPPFPHVHVIRFKHNQGVGHVFKTGARFALEHGYGCLINFDADRQFCVDDLGKIFKPVLSGKYDLALGNRFHHGFHIANMSFAKKMGNWGVSYLVNAITRSKFQDVSCGFRCYSGESLYVLNLFSKFSYTHETILLLCEHNVPIVEVPIQVQYFQERRSRVASNLFKYGVRSLQVMFRILVDFSPQLFWGIIALLFFFPGGLLSILVMTHLLSTGNITPYKWIAFLSAFLLGCSAIFLVLSILTSAVVRIRKNQEQMIYYLKKIYYKSCSAK